MNESENKLFPIFLKLEKFRVLIIGGGKIALEKVTTVLQNSPATQLTLVAKEVSGRIVRLKEEYPNLSIYQRPFQSHDLDGKDFIIIAINDKEASREIRLEAEKRKIITNVADTPECCDFYLGSIVQKGNVKIAVSTNGKSPTIAKRIKETLDESFPDEIDSLVKNLSKVRATLSGSFSRKVKELNEITSDLSTKKMQEKKKHIKRMRVVFLSLLGFILLVTGYLFAAYTSPETISGFLDQILVTTVVTIISIKTIIF